ncbi:MAG: SIMPL domain-containing protein [Sedimentitalea sp.]|nr:SIMPL domain-containing protein [Sedimentitalea sp.]
MPRQITVTGEGRVEAAPDMATISLGVTHENEQAKLAMEATSDAVARILERIAAMGVAPRDMQTRALSLSPVWSERTASDGNRARITGFVASNTVMVRVRDLASLGRILDAVIEDGANDFNGLQFDVQNPEPLMDEARRAAVADAMARAALLAEAAGVTLGPVQSISEQGGMRPMGAMMDMAMRESGVPIAAGEVSVEAMVSMVFAIAQ